MKHRHLQARPLPTPPPQAVNCKLKVLYVADINMADVTPHLPPRLICPL